MHQRPEQKRTQAAASTLHLQVQVANCFDHTLESVRQLNPMVRADREPVTRHNSTSRFSSAPVLHGDAQSKVWLSARTRARIIVCTQLLPHFRQPPYSTTGGCSCRCCSRISCAVATSGVYCSCQLELFCMDLFNKSGCAGLHKA
jgi:hypothetical protein